MVVVVLAAGASRRMGRQKLLLPVDGRPMIEHVLRAAAAWPIVVVVGDAVAAELGATRLCLVRNDAPERGMTHSLVLADAAVAPSEPIAVLLADMPDIASDMIRTVLAAYDDQVDVVAPRNGERFVHPVVFGPRARRKIAALPDGDTLSRLRDDPQLRRRIVEIDVAAQDIDTPAEYNERVKLGPGRGLFPGVV